MENTSIRKIQLVQLEIFKVFLNICKKNNLQYFLDGGTLLGAVRHKGFIPWDDDLDVGMPRKDYNMFCNCVEKELPEWLFFQNDTTDKSYPYSFSKIRKRGTLYTEVISEKSKMKNGVFIDILPYDNIPDKCIAKLRQGVCVEIYKHLALSKANVRPWVGCNGIKRIIKFLEYAPFFLISLPFSHNYICKRYNYFLQIYNGVSCKYLKEPDLRYGKVIVPKECFDSYIELEFEGIKCQCPIGYDILLKALYNDYMTLPPEDKRGNWHHVKIVKL